jgi:hypothetical protein
MPSFHGKRASSHAEQHQSTSRPHIVHIQTAFARRRAKREGVTEIVSNDFIRLTAVDRAWISSSVSGFTKTIFSHRTSFATDTFEMNSKLHRIEEFAFEGSGLRPIQVLISIECVSKLCFFSCSSQTSVTLKRNSQLHRIDEGACLWSGLQE